MKHAQDANTSYSGFLLKGLGVLLALTCDACYKMLPRRGGSQSGEIEPPRGWPRLLWLATDRKDLSKPGRDWQPPARLPDECTALIEVCHAQVHCNSIRALELHVRFSSVHYIFKCFRFFESRVLALLLRYRRLGS